MPLLIVHGWPVRHFIYFSLDVNCILQGNVYEFYKIIPMLTDPRKAGISSDIAFDVVAPSIPGYGWSEAAKKAGMNTAVTARIFNILMTKRLNYAKYIAQGGDWGASVTSNIARFFPQKLFDGHQANVYIMLIAVFTAFT